MCPFHGQTAAKLALRLPEMRILPKTDRLVLLEAVLAKEGRLREPGTVEVAAEVTEAAYGGTCSGISV